MQARYIIITALLVAAVVAVCGCSTVTPEPTAVRATLTPGESVYPMTISDYYDRTATITSEPQRIVSLSPVNTEMLFALGVGSKVVGTSKWSDYPEDAKKIPQVSEFSTVSYENITAINPDLIVAEDIVGEEAVSRLRSLGFPVVEFKNSNLTLIKKSIMLLGKITNTEANATAIVTGFDRNISNISAKTAGLNDSQKPNVLLLTGFSASYPEIFPYGGNTYGDELLNLTGGRNAAANVPQYSPMSKEAIVDADPDYIVIPVDGIYCLISDYEYFKNGNATWMQSLKAVKNGKVMWVDGNLFLRPGPRSPDAGLALARVIHPELFQ
ncbi:MAG: ABC transporter substrate-binding protein [Methanocella sp.]